MDVSKLYSLRTQDNAAYMDLFRTIRGSTDPDFLNFSAHGTGPETYPLDALWELGHEVIARDGWKAFEYADPHLGFDEIPLGFTGLREELSAITHAQGARHIDRDGHIVTFGGSQAVQLACQSFIGPGDAVFVERATWNKGAQIMDAAGARVFRVPVEEDGIDLDALLRAMADAKSRGLRPKMVYVIATFQLPTGVCLSLEKRKRLLEIAKEHELLIVEDNVYGALRYEGEPIPTLLALDDANQVVQVNTFSKTIAPGLRIGWAVGHPDAIRAMAAARLDLGCSQFLQRILAVFLSSGQYAAHLQRVTGVYREKRNVMAAALHEHAGDDLHFRLPQGSFHLWLRISDRIDVQRLRDELTRHKVVLRVGEGLLAADDPDRFRYCRLGFPHHSHGGLREGARRIGKALSASVAN